jgi:uncharacterized protein
MPLVVNLRHLEAHNVRLEGELPVGELDIDPHDEVIRVSEPLRHDLEVQKLEEGLLIQGRLTLVLDCECVRCLKRFPHRLRLDPWTCHLPLQGEEAVAVINDCADLTPYVREDILLEFPQHPLCEPQCPGLAKPAGGKAKKTGAQTRADSAAWAELNKLKF